MGACGKQGRHSDVGVEWEDDLTAASEDLKVRMEAERRGGGPCCLSTSYLFIPTCP